MTLGHIPVLGNLLFDGFPNRYSIPYSAAITLLLTCVWAAVSPGRPCEIVSPLVSALSSIVCRPAPRLTQNGGIAFRKEICAMLNKFPGLSQAAQPAIPLDNCS